jgi:lysylphosphatidylglycerol synthetase-like protein (DUF2156 family)
VVPQGLPNLLGLALGAGGETTTLHDILTAAAVVLISVLLVLCLQKRLDWITGAGLALLTVVVSMSWAQAWYVAWILPFAALTRTRALRVGAVLVTVVMICEFVPAEGSILFRLHLEPNTTALGRQHERSIQRLNRP